MKRKILKIIYIVNVFIILLILGYLAYLAISKYRHTEGLQQHVYAQFRGYQLKLSNDTVYDSGNSSELLLSNFTENWNAKIIIMNDPKNVIFSNIERLEEMLIYNGNDVSELRIHTIDSQQYVTLKKKVNVENVMPYVLLGYYRLDNNRICEIVVNDTTDVDNLNYGGFEKVVKILATAKYDSLKDAEYKYWTLTLDNTLQALYGEDGTSENVE